MTYFYTRSFLSIQLLNELSHPFHLIYSLYPFLNDFFYPKSLLICFWSLFFIKCSTNFFTIEIINNISPWNSIFSFFNHKNFFRPIWSISFSKKVFILWYSNMFASFKFRIFIITFFNRVNICIIFNFNRLHFNCSLIYIVVFIYYIIQFINIHIFWYRCSLKF